MYVGKVVKGTHYTRSPPHQIECVENLAQNFPSLHAWEWKEKVLTAYLIIIYIIVILAYS